MPHYKFVADGKTPTGIKFKLNGVVQTTEEEEKQLLGALVASNRAVDLVGHRFKCKPDRVRVTLMKPKAKSKP